MRRIADLDAIVARRRAMIAAWLLTHGERPFGGRGARDGWRVYVHVDAQTKLWRVTLFDRRGPVGHSLCDSYGEALRLAAFDYGVDLNSESIEF